MGPFPRFAVAGPLAAGGHCVVESAIITRAHCAPLPTSMRKKHTVPTARSSWACPLTIHFD